MCTYFASLHIVLIGCSPPIKLCLRVSSIIGVSKAGNIPKHLGVHVYNEMNSSDCLLMYGQKQRRRRRLRMVSGLPDSFQ